MNVVSNVNYLYAVPANFLEYLEDTLSLNSTGGLSRNTAFPVVLVGFTSDTLSKNFSGSNVLGVVTFNVVGKTVSECSQNAGLIVDALENDEVFDEFNMGVDSVRSLRVTPFERGGSRYHVLPVVAQVVIHNA